MLEKKPELLAEVAEYYTAKLAKHGETPRGVDWNGEESQWLRFAQLAKIFPTQGAFSVNDLGCGFGSFADFLAKQYPASAYCGIDVSEAMVRAAQRRFEGRGSARFLVGDQPDEAADFSVASGIFNVRQKRSDAEWRAYLEATLAVLDQGSRAGFAFNCLTSYSDVDKKRDYLYYADPLVLFDLCKRRYSRQVALLHDYGLYEFTIIVRKDP